MKNSVLAAIAVVVALGGGFGISHIIDSHKAAASESACIASQNVICPPAIWLKEFDRWQQIGSDLAVDASNKKQQDWQDEQDLWSGKGKRLQNMIPNGWDFDEKNRIWILPAPKAPATPTQQVPANPQPAPAPPAANK